MPEQLTSPESNLTYGKVVSYVLDQRSSRLTGRPISSKFYEVLLDVMVVISQLLTIVGYSKYVIDQLVMLITQNDLSMGSTYQISVYICIFLAFTAWLQTKVNYKQISYLSRLGMYVTVLVILYFNFEVFIKFYFLKEN